MRKWIISALVLGFFGKAEAVNPIYGTVQITTSTTISPNLQNGSMKVSSGTINTLTGTSGTFSGTVTAGAFSPASAFSSLLASTNTWTASQVFTSSVSLSSGVLDGSSSLGTSGQSLSSTGSKTQWVNVPSAILSTTSSWTAGQTFTTVTVTTITPTNIVGQSNANAALAGDVGEVIISSIPFASAKPITTGTTLSISTVSLTAGCWSLDYNYGFKSTNAGTSVTDMQFFITLTPGSFPGSGVYANQDSSGQIAYDEPFTAIVPGNNAVIIRPGSTVHFCISGTTPYYLAVNATFSVSTASAFGGIYARREK